MRKGVMVRGVDKNIIKSRLFITKLIQSLDVLLPDYFVCPLHSPEALQIFFQNIYGRQRLLDETDRICSTAHSFKANRPRARKKVEEGRIDDVGADDVEQAFFDYAGRGTIR